MFTFAEMWLARVIMTITTLTAAPWLDGIEELDTAILEVGSGMASEQNIIHVPIENFEVDVLINNTTYPIGTQAYTDTEAIIKLDKYQTKVTTLSDDQIMGSSYPKIDSATRAHTRAINSNKFVKAIHALAPPKNTGVTPVIETTGAVDENGRKKLVYKDLVTLRRKLDDSKTPKEERRLVLSSEHYNDLLEDRDRFANLLSNINNGTVAPKIAGFEIYQYDANPMYFKNASDSNIWTKRPFGTVPTNNDFEASVCFVKANVAKKTGITKQYFADAKIDPANQTNRLNYRHYFVAMPFQQKYQGAIVSGGTATPSAPVIGGATPSPIAVGATLTITGMNFTGATDVDFGVTAATSFAIVNDTEITAVVPTLSAGSVNVKVTGPAGASNTQAVVIA